MSAGAQLFGKLPAHGDFIARGLTASARAAIDDWLSGSLVGAREGLGDSFGVQFDRALPWHCTGPGVAGAIAASQDAAGRRFPIMLLSAGDEGKAERCEALLYAAIADGWDADRLAREAGPPPEGMIEAWTGSDGRRLDGAMPPDLLSAMLA